MYSEMFHKLEHFMEQPDFLAFMPHADSAPGTCIPQREEALSLRHTGQSLLSRDHEEARGTGRWSPVHSIKSQESR
jgi:hypothetical protein